MIRDTVTIDREPRTVWAFVTDPARLPDWNPKAVAVETRSIGSVDLGYRYEVTYRMGGRETVTTNEVEVFRPYEQYEIRVEGGMALNGHAREIYSLQPTSTGTKLTQAIDLRESGIPWLWRLVVAVVHRVGRPTGKRTLVRLKDLIESTTAEEGPPGPLR